MINSSPAAVGASQHPESQDGGLFQEAPSGSGSFYSQSFKQQLLNAHLKAGFDARDCTLDQKLIQLQQLIHQEKSAPEVLPYQHLLLGQVISAIA